MPLWCSPAETREALKEELFEKADAYNLAQRALWASQEADEEARGRKKKGKGFLGAESRGAQRTEETENVSKAREEVVEVLTKLEAANPSAAPLRGWREFGGVAASDCALGGLWQLVFTDAADASFRDEGTTFQVIDSSAGTFVNAVNFGAGKGGKLRGFRVVVEGEALSETEMQLIFKRVKLLRRSRFPRLFGTLTIPLPNPGFLRRLGKVLSRGRANASRKGAGFTMLYLDENLRMHRTFDGLYFVQKRLEEEPPLCE